MKKSHFKKTHSHHHAAIILGMVSTILVIAIAAFLVFFHRFCIVDYVPYDYIESADALSNPYIGWYTLHGYLLADDIASDSSADSASQPGLALIEINLKNYATCDLTDPALSEIDSILSSWAQTGSQLIVRFLYDWDGQNLQSEPRELSQILTHMKQVGPIVNQYASSVYLLQGIFVGNCGEMNNTIHMGNGEMQTLFQTLADVIDPSIFLSVRTPAQWRAIVEKDQFRLGLFNDGMLGSANDTGTYGDKAAADANTNYTDAWRREDELAFQNEVCRYVPNGGEVIIDNEYNDFDNAVKDLSQMHVSYLNSAYDGSVLNKWKETIVNQPQTNTDGIFDGMNGYDYIGRHLGYRYVLRDSSVQFHPLKDQTATLTVDVENVGFSNCYRPLEVTVQIICDRTGQCVRTIAVDTDPRLWNSGETTEFTVPIDVRGLDEHEDTDTYTLYLSCTDPALDRSILFANTQEPTAYGYSLGQLTVSKMIK